MSKSKSSSANKSMADINFSLLGKAEDLKKRIFFTLGILIVYRFGTYVSLPGIDPVALSAFMSQHAKGILGMFNMLSGGALGRMSIFALTIMPYITASIIIQLMTVLSKHFEALKKEGEAGRRKINQYTRYLTVVLAAFQGYGVSIGLEAIQHGAVLILDPIIFRAITVITLVGGTVFLMWLGEQITARGIGNGISLIIFAGIAAELPAATVGILELGRTGAMSTWIVLVVFALALGLIALIVYVERAQRRIVVQYPKQQRGNRMYGGQSSHLPLKLNSAGVIPPIFAGSILSFPATISAFSAGTGPEWLQTVFLYIGRGTPTYFGLYITLIVFFCFFYTSVQFNPNETAENLKKNGGFIPGRRPGKNTADYLDYVLTRLTVVGAAYIAFVCVLPELLMAEYSIPFYLGGTSFLIMVNVVMDTVTQIQTHLFAHQYEGLIKRAKLKGKLA